MIDSFGKTDVGRRRKLNEDNILIDRDTDLYAVCDGMGGHNAGEVASKMAIETLHAFVAKSHGEEKDITWPYGLEPTLSFEANRLKTAIKLANKRIFRAADNRDDYTGMGTTLVAALVNDATLTVGNAGDSRCYLVREGKLTQLTRDDSWVSAAWSEGILSSDEIGRHPLRNVITKAVGAKVDIELETSEHELAAADVVLLCSDGLHGMITDAQILGLLHPFPGSLEEAAGVLIDAANEAGGKDNVSVVLLRYTTG